VKSSTPLYDITYQFESDGGNIQYKTIQKVEKEAETSGVDLTVVTTGLELESGTINGIAVVELAENVDPATVFKSAMNVDRTEFCGNSGGNESDESTTELPADPDPVQDISQIETNTVVSESLTALSEVPGRGAMFSSNLTRCQPFERDLWYVPISGTSVDKLEVTFTDLVKFYCTHLELLEEQPALKIAVYHRPSDSKIPVFACRLTH